MSLSASWLVEQTSTDTLAVDPAAAHEYALCTGDTWTRGEDLGMVPPIFGFVVASGAVGTLLANSLGDSILGMLHVRQEMQFQSPLVSGETIEVSANITGAGPAALGSVISVEVSLASSAGEPRMVQSLTLLLNGVEIEGSAGTKPKLRGSMPPQDREPDSTAKIDIPRDLPARYAEASGDRMPVHLDDEVARSFNFPGVILHGMCTFGLAAGAVVAAAGGTSNQLKAVTARFGEPVLPGSSIVVKTWKMDGDNLAFEVENDSGGQAMRFGTATVGD